MVKILDYANQWNILDASHNPFAVVVQAHLKTLETRQDETSRARWKVTLAKALYKRGFSKDDIIKLYRFIDWLMILPEYLEQACFQEIEQFEEEHHMPYITTAERIGIEKGIKQGRKEGITKGEVIGEIRMAQRMLKRPISSQKELAQKSITTLRKRLQELKKIQEMELNLEKVERIGEIRMAQRILKRPVSPKEDLIQNTIEDLNTLFQSLQVELAKLN